MTPFTTFLWVLIFAAVAFAQNDTGVARAFLRHQNPVNDVIRLDNIPVNRNRDIKSSNCSFNATVMSKGKKILSPNYPNSYDSDLACQWILSAPKGRFIILKFFYFNIEISPNCKYDNLKVYAGENSNSVLIGKYCGPLRDTILRTNSSRVVMTFTTDSTFEERGFEIEANLEPRSIVKECYSEINENEGTVTSPGFPKNYQENTDCWTLIRIAPEKHIFFNFDTISLEQDASCSYDFVEIFDGPSEESPKIGRFCSDVQMANVISSNNTMLLHFHSDSVVNDKGFRAYYSAEGFVREGGKVGDCSWTYTENNGTITSPNYPKKYPSNARCIIYLNAPADHHVKIDIESLLMESDANCSYDWLELRERHGEGSTILGKFCGSKEKQILSSISNKVSVIFNSDGFAEFSGFLMSYWFEQNEFVTFNNSVNNAVLPLVLNPEDAFLHVSPNASVDQGAFHTLACTPKDPTAKIRWFLDDNFIGGDFVPAGLMLNDNTTLTIQKMNRSHVGIYKCAAVMANNVAYAKIWISISYTTPNCTIVLRKTPKDVVVSEKELTILECSSASQGVSISWEKNGETIQTSSDIQILHNGYLMINNVQTKDEGIYTCIANKTVDNCYKSSSAKVVIAKRVNITEVCGRPKFGHDKKEKSQDEHGKIVGGKETEVGAYPWQVMLWEPKRKAFCGGTILNERWILTATHCFARDNLDWKKVIMRLGKHDQTKTEGHEFSTKIEMVIHHPSFEPNTLDNDITLIQTTRHIPFTDYVQPICLGKQKSIEENFFSRPYKMGTVTGWGQLVEGGAVSRFLREVRLPIIPQGTCQQSLVGTRFVSTRNMFCAGNAQEAVGDACRGDSGGPFVVEHENVWYLVGLVSWGDGCAKKNMYGFYTKVNNYHSWIKGIIQT